MHYMLSLRLFSPPALHDFCLSIVSNARLILSRLEVSEKKKLQLHRVNDNSYLNGCRRNGAFVILYKGRLFMCHLARSRRECSVSKFYSDKTSFK